MLRGHGSGRGIRRLAACLLVIGLVASSCGDDGGSDDADPTEPPDETRSVQLNALFFATSSDGEATGGASPVQIRVSPFEGDEFRVGFTEDEVAGTGDQWRAAGWQAASTATLLTGATLQGREVTFDVKGRIDGPSAGAAMTVGTLAAFRGDDLNPDVVMTGTINPDGTIGPVGGIPQKVQGAVAVAEGEVEAIGASQSDEVPIRAAALAQSDDGDDDGDGGGDGDDGGDGDTGGDTDDDDSGDDDRDMVMLIPAGQGTATDLETGENVDVVDLGRREGVDVREVGDIYEAYQEFTGEELPRLDESGDTNLDDEANERIEASVKRWLARYDESSAEFNTLMPAGQSFVLDTGLIDDADQAAIAAQDLSDQGLQAGAYNQATEAAVLAAAAIAAGRGWELGTDEWVADLQSRAAVCGEVEAVVDQLGTSDPATVSDASGLISAYTSTVDAVALCGIADNLLTRPVDTPEQALTDLLLAGVYFEFSDALITASEDQLGFSDGLGGTELDEDVDLTATADFFRRAAEANLNAFDTLIINEVASEEGVSPDLAKAAFRENFIEYALAEGGIGVLNAIDEYFGEAERSAYANLGGALEVYTLTSSLLAQFYSLGAQVDDNFQIVGVENERALLNALDLGEDQVAGTIVSLRGEDVEAPAVVGSFEAARVNREGDISDKFEALSSLWAGYVSGRMLSYLGGFETSGLE